MAIVGLKSPFKKTEKESPLKMDPLTAVQLGTAVLGFFGARKARKRQAKLDREARKRLEEMRQEYMGIEFKNPYSGLENPYSNIPNRMDDLTNQFTGLENVYEGAENVFEDLRVNTQAADFAREQSQQQQANILSQFGGAAGSSGIAGLAQSIAMAGNQQARQASANIAAQEQRNQMLERQQAGRLDQLQRAETSRLDQLAAKEDSRLAGLQAAEETRLDQLSRQGDFQSDMLRRKGAQYVDMMNTRRIEQLYGLSASTATATSQALSLAKTNQASAFGNLFTTGFSAYQSGAFGGGAGGSAPMTTDNNLVPIDYGTGGGTELDLTGSTNASTGLYGNTYNIPGYTG